MITPLKQALKVGTRQSKKLKNTHSNAPKGTLKRKTKKVKKYNHIVYSILPPPISLTFLTPKDEKLFLKENRKTIEIANKVSKHLLFSFLPTIILTVTIMSFIVKKDKTMRKFNSILYIGGRGTGKTEILEHILTKSNPELLNLMDNKTYESQLVSENKEYFHNKVMVQDDLIISFQGMSTKQREQLTNFWVKILEGNYSRQQKKLKNVNTIALFGVAKEMFNVYRKELFSSTFFDRVIPFFHEIDHEQKRKILEHRSKSKTKCPIIKLPIPKNFDDKHRKKINFIKNKNIEERIINLALELDMYEVLSSARAQDFIKIFMMGNALLNHRRKTTINDLKMYELVHPLFLKSSANIGMEKKILTIINANPDKKDKAIIIMLGTSKPTFYKYKKILKLKKLI